MGALSLKKEVTMFNEFDDKNFISAMLNVFCIKFNPEAICVSVMKTPHDSIFLMENIKACELLDFIDVYVDDLIVHGAPYLQTEPLRSKLKYFMRVYENLPVGVLSIRAKHNSNSQFSIRDIADFVIKQTHREHVYEDGLSYDKEEYLKLMAIDGKVLIARYALQEFFKSEVLDFLRYFEQRMTERLRQAYQILVAVQDEFCRMGRYEYNRRINDDLKLNIALSVDEYPASMPDCYIDFIETDETTGVVRNDVALIDMYNNVSKGSEVPVTMHITLIDNKGDVVDETCHGTFATRTDSGFVKILDRSEIMKTAFEQFRDSLQ